MTFSDAIIAEWQKAMEEEMQERAKVVIDGVAVQNIEDYRRMAGIILGMRQALELMEEAAENVRKRS